MRYCVDFDDLISANVQRLDILAQVKERYPAFRATLFAIPNRIVADDIAYVKRDYPWLSLAPHGYEHTKGECIAWSYEEALDKLRRAIDKGLDAPAFRAPGWLIARPTYNACAELGLTVCAHRDMHLKSDVPQYIYNLPMGRPKGVRACHGHLTPCCDNFIGDMAKDGRLSFPTSCEFVQPWDAAVVVSTDEDKTQ